jgi:hypothetical protein
VTSAVKWQADGSTETMHGQLRDRVRQVNGRKRHIAVVGLLLTVLITAASVQDRDAAKPARVT